MSALGRSHLLVRGEAVRRAEMSQAQTPLGKPSLLRDFTPDRPLPMRVRQVPAAIPTLYSLLSILHDPGHKGRGRRHPGGWLGGVVWQGLGWVVHKADILMDTQGLWGASSPDSTQWEPVSSRRHLVSQ